MSSCRSNQRGGKRRRSQTPKRSKPSRKQNRKSSRRKRSYRRKSYRQRKMRRMSGGSGLVDPLTSGLHDATTKLSSNPYVPSNAHIQPVATPYQDDRNPYFV